MAAIHFLWLPSILTYLLTVVLNNGRDAHQAAKDVPALKLVLMSEVHLMSNVLRLLL